MEEKELTIKDAILQMKELCIYLLSKWKIIIPFSILGGGIGLFISLSSKPEYSSTLKFVVEEEQKGGGGMAALASSFGFGGTGSQGSLFSSSNLIEFLKTRSMIEETLLRPVRENKYSNMTYAELYIKQYKMRDSWKDKSKLKKIYYRVGEDRSSFSREKDSILGSIYQGMVEGGKLRVSQLDKENSVLVIDVVTKNEVFSKNFPAELMDVASTYYMESKTKKSKKSVDVLQKQLDSVKLVLYSSMSGAASATDQVFGLNPAMNIQRVASAKQQTQAQMASVVLQELVKNIEIAKVKLLDDTPVITVIDGPIYPLKKDQLGKTKGILIGGFATGFLVIAFFMGRRYLKKNLSEN